MKYVGALMVVLGVAVGLWVGVWWAFVGGIVRIVSDLRAEHMNSWILAMSILRVMFSGFIGYVSAEMLVLPGYMFWKDD